MFKNILKNADQLLGKLNRCISIEDDNVFCPAHVEIKTTIDKEYEKLPFSRKIELACLRLTGHTVTAEDTIKKPNWDFDEYLKEKQIPFKDRVKRDIGNISKLLKSQDQYSTNIENRISKLEDKVDKLVTKLSELDEDKISNLIVSQLQAFIEEQNNSMDTQPAQDDMINNIDLTKAKPAKTTKSKH